MSNVDPEYAITDEVRAIARTAINTARGEGCDCVPDVEMSPTADPPYWFPLLPHDETCTLVAKLQAENAASSN